MNVGDKVYWIDIFTDRPAIGEVLSLPDEEGDMEVSVDGVKTYILNVDDGVKPLTPEAQGIIRAMELVYDLRDKMDKKLKEAMRKL